MDWKKLTYWILIAAFVVAGGYAELLRQVQPQPTALADFTVIPKSAGDWVGHDIRLEERTIDVLKASDHIIREYSNVKTGDKIGFFVAYFRSSKEGSQIHSPKHCLPGGGWAILDKQNPMIQVMDRTWEANFFVIGKRSIRQGVFYWYATRRGATKSEYMLKFKLVVSSLLRQPTDAALVRLTVTGGPDTQSREIAEDFLGTFAPYVWRSLPFEREDSNP
jgi:EpsI family protein